MTSNGLIFLSASVPYREPWTANAHAAEIEEAIVTIARAVFARQGRLLCGGHPSVSPLLADIAGEYHTIDPRRTIRPIITVQSEFFKDKLPRETWDLYTTGWSAIEWTPAGTDRDESLEIMRSSMLGNDPRGLDIAQRNNLAAPAAMFAVGGMEGIRDEAAFFLQAYPASSVYLLKTPGGAAAELTGPSELWLQSLWPTGQFNPRVFETLLAGERDGRLVDLEQQWTEELLRRQVALPSFEVQPYGTMVQWVLDQVLHGK